MLNHELIQISSLKTKKFHDECLQFLPIYCLISKHKQAQLYEKKNFQKSFLLLQSCHLGTIFLISNQILKWSKITSSVLPAVHQKLIVVKHKLFHGVTTVFIHQPPNFCDVKFALICQKKRCQNKIQVSLGICFIKLGKLANELFDKSNFKTLLSEIKRNL